MVRRRGLLERGALQDEALRAIGVDRCRTGHALSQLRWQVQPIGGAPRIIRKRGSSELVLLGARRAHTMWLRLGSSNLTVRVPWARADFGA